MRFLRPFLGLFSILFLSACATNVTPTPIGGSKADGTVTLAFQYGLFQRPVIDWSTAQSQAVSRCKAWGYTNAESFGGQQSHCLAVNGYGNCVSTQINVTYQCTN